MPSPRRMELPQDPARKTALKRNLTHGPQIGPLADGVRPSDIESRFTCQAYGTKGRGHPAGLEVGRGIPLTRPTAHRRRWKVSFKGDTPPSA